jgi:hypothetical protein
MAVDVWCMYDVILPRSYFHVLIADGSCTIENMPSEGQVRNFVIFEVLTVVTKEWRLLGCCVVWLL